MEFDMDTCQTLTDVFPHWSVRFSQDAAAAVELGSAIFIYAAPPGTWMYMLEYILDMLALYKCSSMTPSSIFPQRPSCWQLARTVPLRVLAAPSAVEGNQSLIRTTPFLSLHLRWNKFLWERQRLYCSWAGLTLLAAACSTQHTHTHGVCNIDKLRIQFIQIRY